jgi:predicted amidohydrolase YtcJ
MHYLSLLGGDCILYAGNNQGVEIFIQKTIRIIDLKRKPVVIGMADSHEHPFNLGQSGNNDVFLYAVPGRKFCVSA